MTIIDLTHEINNETPVYPGSGDIQPHFEQSTTVEDQGYASSYVTMGLHVGTHIDSPAHMIKNGPMLDQIPLNRLCCLASVIDARHKDIIDAKLIKSVDCDQGNALLIVTGFDVYWGKREYFTSHPVLTEKAVHEIIKKKIGLVGIDTPSPDRFPFALHKILFSHNILIIENLTHLTNLIGASTIMLYALPLKCKTDGAPARVIALLNRRA